MTVALPGVDANEHVAAVEHGRPLTQRMQVVDRDSNVLVERALVFVTRREVRVNRMRCGSIAGTTSSTRAISPGRRTRSSSPPS
jgi:hypothetical protein